MAGSKSENYSAILFIICLSSSLVPFMGSALNLAMPFINSEFGIKATVSGWIPTVYMLSTAIFQIPLAKVADMYGRRKLFLWGIVIFIVFSVLSALATSVDSLIIYRFFSGVGSAMIFGTNAAILISSVPTEKRGWALGLNSATVYFSLASGPFIGGLLTQYFDWRGIFFVAAFIAVLVLFGVIYLIKDEWIEEDNRNFDFIGSILYGLSLSALIVGFSELPDIHGVVLLIIGVVLLLVFSYYEKRQSNPVFHVKLFLQNKVFKYSSLSALINYSATFAISFMLSLYLQYIRGLSPSDAGLVLIVQSLVMTIAAIFAGKLSSRFAPSTLATFGMSVILVGLIGLTFIGETTSLYIIIAILVVIGFGFGIFSSPNMNILMSSVDKKYYGLSSATAGTMRLVGQSLSMGIAMMAISMTIGNIEFSPEVHTELMSSMRITFIICAILCAFGVYASSVRKE